MFALIPEPFPGPLLHHGVRLLLHLVVFTRRNLALNTRDDVGQHFATRPFYRMNEEMADFVRGVPSSVFDHRVQRGVVVHAPDFAATKIAKSTDSGRG